jgi:hypothetical protein
MMGMYTIIEELVVQLSTYREVDMCITTEGVPL